MKKCGEQSRQDGERMKTDRNWKKMEWIGIIFILFLLVCLMQLGRQPGQKNPSGRIRSLGSGWYQLLNGEQIELTLPCTVTADENGLVILSNTALTRAQRGQVLSVRGLQYDADVWLGRKHLYFYKDNRFIKNDQMKGKMWADIYLPKGTGENALRLVFTCKPGQKIDVQAPLLGGALSIAQKHLRDHAFSALIVFCMIAMGIVSVIVFFFTKHYHIGEKRFLDVALFMILCAVWCMFDSGLYQVYGNHSAEGSVVSFYAFMLMSVPMLHFVKNTVSEPAQWQPRLWICLLYGNAIFQGLLNLLLGIPFIHMLLVTHLLLIVGTISMILLLWKEYRKEKQEEPAFCLAAFGALGISGVTALILYWVFSIYWYDAVFQLGTLLYISILFWFLVRKISGDVRSILEQSVYERISETDRMTGLKNRKAFKRYINDIQAVMGPFEDALLLFIDITGLKQVNDIHGMNRGDEIVIRTARCIQSAGLPVFEPKAEYFRIFGNEFAVIVPDPKKTPDEWKDSIKNEMEYAGQPVRLRMGYSYLKKADGSFQTISDWKEQADAMLSR